jgi:signal transduction histidine kinase
MESKPADPGSCPFPLEFDTPGVDPWQPKAAPQEVTSAALSLSEPKTTSEILARCFMELVRYYRHSSAGRRTSGIVHQMNTPLQVLSFQVELLEHKTLAEHKYLRHCPPALAQELGALRDYRLEKIHQFRQELEKLQALARRLFLQGVHEDNEELSYLDLNQVYQEELELYLAEPFFKHHLEKDFHLQTALPAIFGHYLDFSQSFRNLVDNALEAMAGAARPKLTVETRFHNGERLLRIGDSGPGIPPEIFPRIFDPFVTTKGTPARPRAGLGLFMARRLLAPYGGQIQIDSQPGETWATVRLPVAGGR